MKGSQVLQTWRSAISAISLSSPISLMVSLSNHAPHTTHCIDAASPHNLTIPRKLLNHEPHLFRRGPIEFHLVQLDQNDPAVLGAAFLVVVAGNRCHHPGTCSCQAIRLDLVGGDKVLLDRRRPLA